ncbi:unnamed protein product [Menidia menidia]|nr:unnamed protein product [Menidia menidia]
MDDSGLCSKSGRRVSYYNTFKVKDLVNGQIPRAGLANGAVVPHGFLAAACRNRESTPVHAVHGPKQTPVINGYINHVNNPSASGKVESVASVSSSDPTKTDAAVRPIVFDQVVPDPILKAPKKKNSRKNKFKHKKKRDNEFTSEGSSVTSEGSSITCPMPPHEKEDWESELQEVKIKDWEKMRFGHQPYGPADVLPFALRDLTLHRTQYCDIPLLPLTANYRPDKRHPHPVKWTCYNHPTEPGQFADANE